MDKKIAIIGAGVAGLAAAISLNELGIAPLLIEPATTHTHKVCGEFLSPVCLEKLKSWGINPYPITKAGVATATRRLEFAFPHAAGALSHMVLDPQLWSQAEGGGTIFMTGSTVVDIVPRSSSLSHHRLTLSSGAEIECTDLIVATGRIPALTRKPLSLKYKGFKAHLSHIPIQESIELFACKGAYIGIAPVSEGVCNVAGLATLSQFSRHANIEAFLDDLMAKHPLLRSSLGVGQNLFPSWMMADIPEFGCRPQIPWPHTYLVGDAAGSIPPATGNGLSMAIASGALVASYASRSDYQGYKTAWSKLFASSIAWGKAMHFTLMHPLLTDATIRVARKFPSISQSLYDHTRQS
jgi:flavin-dependent dehydrogenase